MPDAQLRRPEGIVVDRDGNLWVADYGRDRVVKLAPTAAEVIRLCDGGRTVDAIIIELQAKYVGPGLAADVVALIGRLAEQRVLE